MAVINTNTGSLYAQQSLNTNARGLATVMQQLSTGKRINSAVDDVAGLAISTRLTSQIRGLNQAVRNANDGISLIQTAEGATEQITNMLQRMRELAVQSSNDTNNAMDRGFLDGEFQQLKGEINRIGQNTQWNGANILDGTGGIEKDGKFAFQVGANSRQTIGIKLGNLQTYSKKTLTFVAGATAKDGKVVLTGLDALTKESDIVGRSVSVTVENKTFSYVITKDDYDASKETTPVLISTAVSAGLEKAMEGGLTDYSADGTTAIGTLEVTANAGVTADFDVSDPTPNVAFSGGGELSQVLESEITSGDAAYEALGNIDSVMQTVNAQRSSMGAVISRLQFASDNLSNVAAKAAESRSRIEDTDYSMATTELAKRNIIQQAAQAMLAQANQAPQLVLQLLK